MAQIKEISKIKELPSKGGAYLLLIDIHKPLTLPQKKFAKHPLQPGRYVYAGSAYGPGGLKARVSRHIKKRKTKRWHIDYISTQEYVDQALVVVGARECQFITDLIDNFGAISPIKGLGSSDCKRCNSHFVRLKADFDLKGVNLDPENPVSLWKRP